MIEVRSLLEREKSLKILKIMENHRFVFYLSILQYIYKYIYIKNEKTLLSR